MSNKELAKLQEQLMKQAQEMATAIEPTGGNTVKPNVRGGFDFPDGEFVEEPLQVVILAVASRKEYYDKPYKQGEVHPPACAAVGTGTFDELVPDPKAPRKQHDTCAGCPMNEFGTAPNGSGKACTDRKVIAFQLPNATEDDAIFTLKISPSGLRDFSNYMKRLVTRHGLPPVAFISELRTKPAGSSVTTVVKEVAPLPEDKLGAFVAKQAEAQALVLEPPQFEAS